MRQSKRRREFNLKIKDNVREAVKVVRKLLAEEKRAKRRSNPQAMSALDKAVKRVSYIKYIVSKKSRLAKASSNNKQKEYPF